MIALLLMELTDSTLVAPGLSLGAVAGLLALAAREYRAARREDVEGERKRRIEAEEREKTTGTTMSSQLEQLSVRVRSLEGKIDEMRSEHSDQIEALRVQYETDLLDERGKNYALRKLLRDNGVAIPEELGPK